VLLLSQKLILLPLRLILGVSRCLPMVLVKTPLVRVPRRLVGHVGSVVVTE
jgi:hypothetical protein